MQLRHTVVPLCDWYFPFIQGLHDVRLELPVNFPATQSEQISSVPTLLLNFPARQGRHDVLPGDVVSRPVAQVGHDVSRLGSGDAVPIGHFSQDALPVKD